MRGLCVLTEAVAGVVFFVGAGVDVDVVFARVFHPWPVRGAVSGPVGAGTTTRVAGGRLGGGLPDARLLARAARVSTIARKLSKTVDAP